ncbi:MAG: hypothetical protein IPL61_07765 [Myxococcales bacterium]|nr:hypothetical protein [Myxococcales bacterium]
MLALTACDPIDHINVRFPVAPGPAGAPPPMVTAYWVQTYQGRTYAQFQIVAQAVTGPELNVTVTECCGTAAAYRAGKLAFLGCIERADAAPELVCGAIGAPDAAITHARAQATSCAEVAQTLGRANLDLATCTLTPIRPAPAARPAVATPPS